MKVENRKMSAFERQKIAEDLFSSLKNDGDSFEIGEFVFNKNGGSLFINDQTAIPICVDDGPINAIITVLCYYSNK